MVHVLDLAGALLLLLLLLLLLSVTASGSAESSFEDEDGYIFDVGERRVRRMKIQPLNTTV